MDPQVRYCTTTDGLSIGYWSIGGGETVKEHMETIRAFREVLR